MNTHQQDKAMRGEFRAMLALAGPLVLANLLQMAVYAVDVIFIARLGELQLAASSLGVSIYGLILWATTGLIGATAPLIASELGRKRHSVREVRRTVRMGLWMAVMVGAPSMLICHFGETLILWSGQQSDVAQNAGQFLSILKWAVIPAILAALLRIFVSALGRAAIGTAITLLALIINSLGNWLFVFGHGGFPAMGLEGSALSSVITTLAMLGAYILVIQSDRRLRRYALFGRFWRPEWSRLRTLFVVGLPIAVTVLAEGGLFNGAAFLMGLIGPSELAAHTVTLQLAAIAFQVPFGVAQAATIRVGYHYGAGDRAAIARAGQAALIMGIGFMGLTALSMIIAPRLLLSLYVDPDAPQNAALIGFALQYLVVAAAFQLLDGAQAVGAGLLRGLQDTSIPMRFALFGYWVPGLMTCVALGFYTPLKGLGVWIGLAMGLLFVASLMLWRWSRRERLGLVVAPDATPTFSAGLQPE